MHSSAGPELNCADLTPTLERRWDGELSTAEAAALESHLATCADCARKASVFERIQSKLRAVDRSSPVLPSGAEWTRRVAAQERGFRQGRRALGVGGLALAGATVAVGLFFRGSLPLSTPSPERPGPVLKSAAASTSLPMLLVIDDEEGGRQVFQSAPRLDTRLETRTDTRTE